MDDARAELLQIISDWDRAMVANDADAIGSFIAADWVLVGSDGSIGVYGAR